MKKKVSKKGVEYDKREKGEESKWKERRKKRRKEKRERESKLEVRMGKRGNGGKNKRKSNLGMRKRVITRKKNWRQRQAEKTK